MFESCETLADLNAERAKMCLTENVDIVKLNNEYNLARLRIISERNQFIKLTPIYPSFEPVQQFSGIPIAGRSTIHNCIQFTPQGFYF